MNIIPQKAVNIVLLLEEEEEEQEEEEEAKAEEVKETNYYQLLNLSNQPRLVCFLGANYSPSLCIIGRRYGGARGGSE